jgi:hypothetical protein
MYTEQLPSESAILQSWILNVGSQSLPLLNLRYQNVPETSKAKNVRAISDLN